MRNETRQAINWFKGLLALSKRAGKAKVRTLRGKLLFLNYDPKTKEQLPYYDTMPMIFVLEVRSTYLLGLNLHYLGYADRKKLVDAIYQFGVDDLDDEEIMIKLRYSGIEAFSRTRYAKVCLKKYKVSNIRNWMIVPAKAWNHLIYLPLYDFRKQNASIVWKESHDKLGST